MLEKNLRELGYDVAGTAATADEALPIVQNKKPSLVLLDIRLEGSVDGIEIAKIIHRRFCTPVVYLTAYSDMQTFDRAIETALYGYLIKPVSINALRIGIEVALEKFRIEQALLQANAKLKLLSAITRHDILNTLTALRNYVDLAKETSKDPDFLKHLEREDFLLRQIQRQIEFTRDYETIGMEAPVWHDLGHLIDRVAKTVIPKTIKMENLTGGTRILADPLFEKVIYNLVENAVRHGPPLTTIRFSITRTGSGLTITCEDDGTGILPEEKEKIFERGFGKNTGLGLFLAKEILSITGLTIRETGTPGRGAHFEILVPDNLYKTAG
jgi:signal transduction histidine kinase